MFFQKWQKSGKNGIPISPDPIASDMHKYYNINMTQTRAYPNGTVEYLANESVRQCTQEDFESVDQLEYFKTNVLPLITTYGCINNLNNMNLTGSTQGGFGELPYKEFFEINIAKCNQEQIGTYCQTDEEIRQELSDTFYNARYVQRQIDFNKYE